MLLDRVGQGQDVDSVLQRIAFGLWRIWKCHNEAVFNDNRIMSHIADELWCRQVSEFQEAMEVDNGEEDRSAHQVLVGDGSQIVISAKGWTKPEFGRLKLNTNAAWQKETKVGGVGWVLREFAGIPKMVGGNGGDYFLSSDMAEAATIRQGLQMCVLRGFHVSGEVLEVESDSEGLVQMLNKEIQADVLLEVHLVDIWNIMQSFQSVKFIFTSRQYNRVAHMVAAYVLKHGGSYGWDELGPQFLFNILAEDANISIRI
ncbi:uncharacterized protein [Malus domestica]|uniref:uncharacterized protein n=1 Tax=Malus domestica TaxID=3750 RepID=UPI0010AA0EC8|nr:uncharacterized protein LOC114826102 [Malus domestica]